jgi:hypothetical protein
MLKSSAGGLANVSCCSDRGDHPKTGIAVTGSYILLHYVEAHCTSM